MEKEKTEVSAGVIPIRVLPLNNKKELLIVRHISGHFSFPKGHIDADESIIETAQRELKEETNLTVTRWLSLEPFEESYSFYRKTVLIKKKVFLFPAFIEGKIQLQESELTEYLWIKPSHLDHFFTFPDSQLTNQAILGWLVNFFNP